ncbi:uncharacterized protein LOC134092274 [Sardina pilchardus]|uniref:uncharacterized protein LOC134092274 n=1 Tax=Sardina pilchardus TaxID=27697 RepID=UPI002E0E8E43
MLATSHMTICERLKFPIKMAASQRQWSEEKERLLISFYSEHEYLWNPRAKQYKNRDVKNNAYKELCQQLTDEQQVINEEDVKKKFKNLRTVFTREHSSVLKSNKSGAGADDVYVPKWKYYQVLSFLRDTCNPDESSDNLDPAVPTTSQTPENTAPLSPTSSRPDNHTAVSDPKNQKSDKKQQLDKASDAMDYAIGVLKRKASSPHAGFLHYLESVLDDMSESKTKKLKRQIIDLAHSVLEEE